MKVMLVNGSSHLHGTTMAALEEMIKVFHSEEVETEVVQLGGKPIADCLQCNVCQKTGKCVIKDDGVNEFVEKAKTADGFVFATPVYFAHPSGRLYDFLDRAFYSAGGSKLAVCICHDGMIPELAREAAYKGCNVYIRISGYSTQVNDQWILTNRSNAWQNLMYTVSVNLAGYDGVFYYFGEGQITNYDGTVLVQGQRNPYEIVTGEIHPELADQARKEWGLENNIYNLGHRGYVAKPGGESDSGLTYIKDLAEGKYHLPWEDDMDIKDGTIYGYPTTGGRFGTEPSPDPYGIHEYKGIDYHTKK